MYLLIRVSAVTVSDLNRKMYKRIEAWRSELKTHMGGEVKNVAVLVAVGLPQPLSMIAHRPRGPGVDLTATARFSTPLISHFTKSDNSGTMGV